MYISSSTKQFNTSENRRSRFPRTDTRSAGSIRDEFRIRRRNDLASVWSMTRRRSESATFVSWQERKTNLRARLAINKCYVRYFVTLRGCVEFPALEPGDHHGTGYHSFPSGFPCGGKLCRQIEAFNENALRHHRYSRSKRSVSTISKRARARSARTK